MRFFTLAAYNHWHAEHDDEALDRVFSAYTAHLEAMAAVLPASVLELARLKGVHDGLLFRVRRDRGAQTLTLTLRCGDLVMGYYDLVLEYRAARMSTRHRRRLSHVVNSVVRERSQCDLAYHELDSEPDGCIVHRMLFFPGLCLAISCDALRWHTEACPDREFPRHRKRARRRGWRVRNRR